MATFKFRYPDGSIHPVEAPDRNTAREIVRRQFDLGRDPSAIGSPTSPSTHTSQAPQDFGGVGANLAAGFGQGLLDLPEGAAQLAEHVTGISMAPQGLRDWARSFRQRAESTPAGQAGEFAGNVLPAFFQPELGLARAAEAVPYAGRALGFAGRVLERGTAPAVLQPVDAAQGDGSFAGRKAAQAVLGTGLGTAGEAVASGLGRVAANQAARQTAAQQAAATHAADLAAFQTGTAQRAAEQAARAQAQTAKQGVPGETTLRWQRETLNRIGLGGQAPTAVTPEASARVQQLVGARLNALTNRMSLDPADPSFIDTVRTVRDQALGELPESARAGWFHQPAATPQASLLFTQAGAPLPRAARVSRATGDFVRTVMEPLEKGPLTGRAFTDYISKLGARAEELARMARTVPQDQRAELYTKANALRQIEDAAIGHAAGNPADKTALESARKAYSMWSIGNDAGRASQGGVMTPQRLIQTISRRMGEARYKQALADPRHPDHQLLQWLESQRQRHTAPLPGVRAASAVPPRPKAPVTPPASHPLLRDIADLGFWALFPRTHYLAHRFGRPALGRVANQAGPALTRAAARTARGVRRTISPASRAIAGAVEQVQEEP